MGRRPRTAREKFGEEIRTRRGVTGLTQAELARHLVCSPTLISHYEAGRRLPTPDDAQRIDQALGTDDFFTRWLKELTSTWANYFAAMAELERQATQIKQFALSLVPGMLQTPEYARAVFKGYRSHCSPEELDRSVAIRTGRAQILEDPSQPVVWTLLDEGVLRRHVGGPQVMAEQLHKIADMAEAGRLRFHVLPHSAGAHALAQSDLTLLSFEHTAPVAYVEGFITGNLMKNPALVAQCRTAYDLALSEALPREKSLDFVRAVAKGYAHAER
ncbi:Scr1 family TA system antitoxin-like transcriptional regulator [Streptomyces griseofuscus]|uniref:helix-turn-helix domain-containing protein n=1 Tax=Streptomyces griseofuscus TaxID=146922 RepID=UPI0036CCF5E6